MGLFASQYLSVKNLVRYFSRIFIDSLSWICAFCEWQRAGNVGSNSEAEFQTCQNCSAIPTYFVIREHASVAIKMFSAIYPGLWLKLGSRAM